MSTPSLMPVVASPRKRADGEAFTEGDREFWELQENGGIRRKEHREYPRMLYRASSLETGKIQVEQTVATAERHHQALEREGWVTSEADAKAQENARLDALALAAAEAEASARKLSDKAQRERRARDAKSDGHLTE